MKNESKFKLIQTKRARRTHNFMGAKERCACSKVNKGKVKTVSLNIISKDKP